MVTPPSVPPAPARRSAAWLLRGISSIPGELVLGDDGFLAFVAAHAGTAWPWQVRRLARDVDAPGLAAALAQGRPTPVMRWPVREVHAWCPWHYLGGGLKLRRGGVTLRVSLGEPANTTLRAGRVDPTAAPAEVRALAGTVRAMRRSGRAWREALARAGALPGG